MILAYCLGERGLRLTAAWASSMGLADISNVALLLRLRQCGDWLTLLVGQVLAAATPAAGKGRLIRLVDATMVPKAGKRAKTKNSLWRIHSAFDLPSERFGFFELTDEEGGERLDRIPVVPDEIRIADRAYLQPDRMAVLLDAGADLVIRSGWKGARWLDADGLPLDIIAILREGAKRGLIDRPIQVGRKEGPALELRMVALKKSPEAANAAKRKARKQARRGGHQISKATLVAAEWIILITSLKPDAFSAKEILDLYRLRWRIELAFKRLKSLIGLKAPPGTDERSAKPYLLAHLLVILLLEPLIGAFEDSPHWQQAA
ncbi:MAG TPA: transposase [Hyphomicrobiaceae bacterium]|nr:transposase [Hyphomicrobiaceae bacterium]